jgi:hypothetical protein
MAQLQVQLEMETGAGGTALAGKVGTVSDAFDPVWEIAFQGAKVFYALHGSLGTHATYQLDAAIESLQWNRADYAGLTPVQQAMRPQAEAYLIALRDLCRKHPAAKIVILP